jgi:branched-chain amino acid transport system substrate-binding protein
VNVIVADDGGDPARSKANVKDLVEHRGVVAIVSDFSLITRRSHSSYLTEKRIPVVGGEGGTSEWLENPTYFSQVPYGDVQIYGALTEAKLAGRTKLAFLYCAEAQTCSDAVGWASDFAPEVGVKLVYQGQISVAQPDFTAECLQARNRRADVVFFAADHTAISRGVTSCNRQGYNPLYMSISAMQTDELTHNSALAAAGLTMVGNQPTFPWFLKDGSPGVKDFALALQRYAPGTAPAGSTAIGWSAAKLLEKAIRRSGDASSVGILQGLWGMRDETLDGLTIPLTFAEGQKPSKGRCWFATQIRDGQWQAPLGPTARCAHRTF